MKRWRPCGERMPRNHGQDGDAAQGHRKTFFFPDLLEDTHFKEFGSLRIEASEVALSFRWIRVATPYPGQRGPSHEGLPMSRRHDLGKQQRWLQHVQGWQRSRHSVRDSVHATGLASRAFMHGGVCWTSGGR